MIATALFPLACGYFMSFLLRAVNAVVAPNLVADIGLTPAELGLLTSAYLVAFALFQLPLGVLLDRYGPRRVQAALLMTAALGCVGFAFAQGFGLLFMARAIIGLGLAAGLMSGLKATILWVPAHRRAITNSAFMAAGALGTLMATGPTEWLVSLVGWRNAFAIFAGILVVCAAFIFSVVPDQPKATTRSSTVQQTRHLLRIMRLPLFWRIAPLMGFTTGIQIGVQTLWAGPWLHDVLGLGREGVAQHLMWIALAFMIGVLCTGAITDWLGRRGVSPMTVMLCCFFICFLGQAFIISRWPVLALPGWLLVAATGQAAILSYPWFAMRVGAELAGRSNATINFVMFVCAFASQYGVGVVLGFFPVTEMGYSPEGYSWAFGSALVLQFIALAWYLAAPIASLKEAPTT